MKAALIEADSPLKPVSFHFTLNISQTQFCLAPLQKYLKSSPSYNTSTMQEGRVLTHRTRNLEEEY